MSEPDRDPPAKTAHQKLSELVEQRKAATGRSGRNEIAGQRQTERAAAARSFSKSKPALRK
jgi:hypothetical protein